MAPDDIARATERFFRGRHRSPSGSGLGLSIAQLAMARIGGELRLESPHEGGLVASLVLPPRDDARSS